MPRRDGTGPIGMGQMTGGGRGTCGLYASAGCFNPIGGFGTNGYARGYRRQFNESNEKAFLSNQEAILQNQLVQVKERLSYLKDDDE